jgi:16S rRNA (uracil1498-N3)-methyltransferase
LGRSDVPPLRSLPRVFLPGLYVEQESYELPRDEVDKLRKVLRLAEGDQIAVLPNDGRLIRCEFRARQAWPLGIETPNTEPEAKIWLAQAFPKGDRIDTILRMGTELGAYGFALFPADRSVVRWDADKLSDKKRRFEAVVRESAEQSFRTRLPLVEFFSGLGAVLERWPDAVVLSEREDETRVFRPDSSRDATLVVGPEGGWAPRELELIGDRGVTLGPLVLRTDTAAVAAIAAARFG